MPRIFISYRRDDSAGHAGRLYDRLRAHFGADRVFMDVTGIEAGTDFVEAIDSAVGGCDVLIAVIGRQWANCTDPAGRRRLEDPQDFVSLEVGSALHRQVRVVPVLVEGALMPGQADLPESLRGLTRRQAVELRDTRWDADVEDLVAALERIPAPVPQPATEGQTGQNSMQTGDTDHRSATSGMPRAVWVGAGVLIALLVGGIGWLAGNGSNPAMPEAVPEKTFAPPALSGPEQPVQTQGMDTTPAASPAPATGRPSQTAHLPATKPSVISGPPASQSGASGPVTQAGPTKTVDTPSQPVQARDVAKSPAEQSAVAASGTGPSATTDPQARAPVARRTRRVVILAWGNTTHRAFWGNTSAENYSRRMAELFDTLLKKRVPEGFETRPLVVEKDAQALVGDEAETTLGRLCADGSTAWVFAARAEEPFAISPADSAFWPELRLVAARCGSGDMVRVRHGLAPRQGEPFPFAQDMREAMQAFLRGQGRLD